MAYRLSNKLKIKQVQELRTLLLTASVSIVIVGLSVIILHLKHPERALAASRESSYTLNRRVPETYTVTCGSVNASNRTIKGLNCNNINIYPNPFRDKFSVDFVAEADQQVTVRMSNLQGKVLHFENHMVKKGSNTVAIAPPVKVQSGNYFIQVLSHGNVIGSAKAEAN